MRSTYEIRQSTLIDNNHIMEITDSKVTQYIQGLYRPLNSFLAELRLDAESRDVPIIGKEIETVLLTLLTLKKPNRLIEVGTAVGYSALCFAMSDQVGHITTLELQETLCREAFQNFRRAGMDDKIRLIQGDALMSLEKLIREETDSPGYDFIFIDGAKGHYLRVFDLCMHLCRPGTVIVADNVLYRAMTAADEYLDIRRNKTIVNRMRAYLNHITHLPGITTTVLPVGDGLAISVLKG